jgi:U3 small nucleolar RNA-associated protein 25
VQSTLSKFNAGKIPFLLITERAFYFDVCQIRKMKHLLFFQMPHHVEVYRGLVETIYDDTTKKY